MASIEAAHALATIGAGITAGMAVSLLVVCFTRWSKMHVEEWADGLWSEFVTLSAALVPAFAAAVAGFAWSLALSPAGAPAVRWWWSAIIGYIVVTGMNVVWFVPTNVRVRNRDVDDLEHTRSAWAWLHALRTLILLGALVAATRAIHLSADPALHALAASNAVGA